MGNDSFSFSSADMILLRKLFKRSPRQMQRVTAGVLNDQAFQMRPVIFKVLSRNMEIRDTRFAKSRIRVDKARPTSINSQSSEVGSIFSDRFTGWEEQQTGKQSKGAKVYTKFSRRGSWSNKVRQNLRRRQKNPLWRPSDFNIKAKSERHRLIVFLQMINSKRITDRFFMPDKLGRMTRGIYTMNKGKIRKIVEDKFQKPHKIAWMDKSIDQMLRSFNIKKSYAENVERVFRLR